VNATRGPPTKRIFSKEYVKEGESRRDFSRGRSEEYGKGRDGISQTSTRSVISYAFVVLR